MVLIASILAAVGYLLLSLSQSPNSNLNFLYLFLIGFGEIGLIVSSLGLVTHSSVPSHYRGSVAGFASFFGAAGILVCSKLGGYLFDNWYAGGAFMLLAIIHFIFIGIGFVIIIAEARKRGGLCLESLQDLHQSFQSQQTIQ